jgi:iron complex transport system ATP-binding protein
LKLAVVGQENEVPFDFLIEEIVAMGRSPHKKFFDPDPAEVSSHN